MKIVPYDEFVTDDVVRAVQAARTADEKRSADFFEGAQWCRDNMSGYVRELTTCGECIFSHKLHRDLFCRQLRRSSVPETEIRVEATDFCSFGIRRGMNNG